MIRRRRPKRAPTMVIATSCASCSPVKKAARPEMMVMTEAQSVLDLYQVFMARGG